MYWRGKPWSNFMILTYMHRHGDVSAHAKERPRGAKKSSIFSQSSGMVFFWEWCLMAPAWSHWAPPFHNCETQLLTDQKLSSPIFTCRSFVCLFVRPASVTSPLISTIWCFRPYKPYIFWKLMTPTIHWPTDHSPITHRSQRISG